MGGALYITKELCLQQQRKYGIMELLVTSETYSVHAVFLVSRCSTVYILYIDHLHIACQILSDFYSIQHFYWMKNRLLKRKSHLSGNEIFLQLTPKRLKNYRYVSRKQYVVKNKAFIFPAFCTGDLAHTCFLPSNFLQKYFTSHHLLNTVFDLSYLIHCL